MFKLWDEKTQDEKLLQIALNTGLTFITLLLALSVHSCQIQSNQKSIQKSIDRLIEMQKGRDTSMTNALTKVSHHGSTTNAVAQAAKDAKQQTK
ncbi:MAG: hypothetical protein ILP11_01210 [Alphaproteobacteria bacterium]|nr:hypothetical protein [Alphaproteobacteria bacterium]